MTYTLTARAAGSAGSGAKTAGFTVGPRLGLTVNVQAGLYAGCAGGPVDLCSAKAVDALLGIRAAQAIQKVYLQRGQLPASVLSSWRSFVINGGKLLISFKPSPALTDDAAFAACVAACHSTLGTSWKGTLWQEPNTSKSADDGITSALVYQSLVEHYGPIFRAQAPGIPLVYCPALCGKGDACNALNCGAYFPSNPALVDEFYVDFYGTAWYGTRGGRLEDVVGLADGLGIPFGLGEWGPSASSSWIWNAADWQAYVSYITSFFVARRAAGRRIGWLLYWGANAGGAVGSSDVISDANDPKIPGIQSFFQALGG